MQNLTASAFAILAALALVAQADGKYKYVFLKIPSMSLLQSSHINEFI
jgi:hypothetical protein